MRRGPKPGSEGALRISKARKAAMADPAVLAKMSAARKAAWADPAVRAKMGWLSPGQTAKIVDEIKRGAKPYVEIALDWRVSLVTVARIAREAGVQRRPRGSQTEIGAPARDGHA